MENIEFTDRYGGNPPSQLRGCYGPCEAMGVVPVYQAIGDQSGKIVPVRDGDEDVSLVAAWHAAEAVSPSEDGWHFVPCPECHGTGRVSWFRTIARVPRWLIKGMRFTFIEAPRMDPNAPRWKTTWRGFKCAYLVDLGLWRPGR